MAKLISKTYGEALFELAVEEQKTDAFLEDIQGLRTVLQENPDFSTLMEHPKIDKEEKIQVIENVFKGQIIDELVGFLELIVNKDRYRDINAILDYFQDKLKEFQGIGVAYVKTAIPLSAEQKQAVEDRLLATNSFNRMEMHYDEDKTLIGGMVIRIGDRVVDSSVKSKLADLEKELLKIQLA